jgi:hypothetical protein
MSIKFLSQNCIGIILWIIFFSNSRGLKGSMLTPHDGQLEFLKNKNFFQKLWPMQSLDINKKMLKLVNICIFKNFSKFEMPVKVKIANNLKLKLFLGFFFQNPSHFPTDWLIFEGLQIKVIPK